MSSTKVFKSEEVTLNFIAGSTLKDIVESLFKKLPDGAKNIQIHMRYPTWVRMAPVDITVNGIVYPVIVIRKDIPKDQIDGAEVWLECQEEAPKLVSYV